jgi:hypothetical protein
MHQSGCRRRRSSLLLPALALAGCAAGNGHVAIAPVIAPPATQAVPARTGSVEDDGDAVVGGPIAAKTAMEEAEELLVQLKRYRAGPPIWGEPADGKYHDAKTAVRTAGELLGKLREAYEAAPENGKRIARKVLEAGWFLQTAVIVEADPEDRHAAQDVRDELKRFRDRVSGR